MASTYPAVSDLHSLPAGRDVGAGRDAVSPGAGIAPACSSLAAGAGFGTTHHPGELHRAGPARSRGAVYGEDLGDDPVPASNAGRFRVLLAASQSVRSCIRVCGGAAVIAAAGACVLASWYGILPEWVRIGGASMKPVTAGGFMHVGAMIAALAADRRYGTRWTWWALALLAVTLFSNSLCLFWGTLNREACAIEKFLPQSQGLEPLTAISGHPSTGTAHGFVFLAIGGLLALAPATWRGVAIFGAMTAGLGVLSLLGWILNIPALYWYVPSLGAHTAMAYNTAGLFLASGALMVLAGADHRGEQK